MNYYELVADKNLTEDEKEKYQRFMVPKKSVVMKIPIYKNIDGKDVLVGYFSSSPSIIQVNYDKNNKPLNVQVVYGEQYIKEMFPNQTVRSIDNSIIK